MMKVSGRDVNYPLEISSEILTVEDEHDSGQVKGPLLVPEDHLAKIAHIANLGIPHAEFPGRVSWQWRLGALAALTT
jgi:hypothetical protein